MHEAQARGGFVFGDEAGDLRRRTCEGGIHIAVLEGDEVALRVPRQVRHCRQSRRLIEHEGVIVGRGRANADLRHVSATGCGVSISIRHDVSPTGDRCAGLQLASGVKGDRHRCCRAQNTPP